MWTVEASRNSGRGETRLNEFEDFYNANFSRLVGSIVLVCGNREQAEDAVQEAFIRLVPRWNKIASYDDPVAWVRRVALNQASNGRRSLRRDEQARARWNEAARQSAGVHDAELWSLLGALAKRDREVLVLYYVLDLSLREVSRDLGCSEAAVKSRLSRARARLREIFEN